MKTKLLVSRMEEILLVSSVDWWLWVRIFVGRFGSVTGIDQNKTIIPQRETGWFILVQVIKANKI